MSCGHCLNAVREAASQLDGVDVKTVEIGSLVVELDEAKTTVGAVVDAVADAGYDATELA